MIDNIQEKINEERDEFNNKTLSTRKKDRLDAQLNYYQQWLGKLSTEQKTFISLANDENVQLRNFAIKARKAGIVKLSQDQRTFHWG